MTPSQQAVEAALNHFDDPEMVWHGPDGEKGRTLAAEVRRLRVENARLEHKLLWGPNAEKPAPGGY